MSHRYHPNPEVDDPEDAIYFDDCADCEHHAKATPYNADYHKARKLWELMLGVETNYEGPFEFLNRNHIIYLTENEAVACQTLWRTYIFLERFTSINPKELPFK
jgi:hypothetical protein